MPNNQPSLHFVHAEACTALRIVLVTVARVSRPCENFPDGFDLHLLKERVALHNPQSKPQNPNPEPSDLDRPNLFLRNDGSRSRFGVQGSGFRFQGSGFRVQGSGFRVQGSGFRVRGSEFRIQNPVFRIQSPGFRHSGSGFRSSGVGSHVLMRSASAEPETRSSRKLCSTLGFDRLDLTPWGELLGFDPGLGCNPEFRA